MQINIFIALIAGLISFISPCVLPLVPIYIAYISGMSVKDLEGEKRPTLKILVNSLFFVLGFTIVFTLFALLFYTATNLFGSGFQVWFNRIAGVVLIIFGLHVMGVITIPFLNYEARIRNDHVDRKKAGILPSFIMGVVFAAGWSPCVGPILASILTLAADASTAGSAIVLLIAYSLGIGIPFILTGLATSRLMGLFKSIKKHYKIVEIIAGGFLVILGILIVFDLLSLISAWMTRALPGLSNIEGILQSK